MDVHSSPGICFTVSSLTASSVNDNVSRPHTVYVQVKTSLSSDLELAPTLKYIVVVPDVESGIFTTSSKVVPVIATWFFT